MKALVTLAAVTLFGTAHAVAQPPGAKAPVLRFEDQFERPADVADLRGAVVVLVYGDRKGTDACRALGEQIHVAFHPTARGMTPGKARQVPVAPPGPDVIVIPVACCGNVPGLIKGLIRSQVAKASPDVVVWLDFQGHMKEKFGVRSGEANLVVLDTLGQARHIQRGISDGNAVVKFVQSVRDETTKRP